jgi:hypothetical protein
MKAHCLEHVLFDARDSKGTDCCWRISYFRSVLPVSSANLPTQPPRTPRQHPDLAWTAVI